MFRSITCPISDFSPFHPFCENFCSRWNVRRGGHIQVDALPVGLWRHRRRRRHWRFGSWSRVSDVSWQQLFKLRRFRRFCNDGFDRFFDVFLDANFRLNVNLVFRLFCLDDFVDGGKRVPLLRWDAVLTLRLARSDLHLQADRLCWQRREDPMLLDGLKAGEENYFWVWKDEIQWVQFWWYNAKCASGLLSNWFWGQFQSNISPINSLELIIRPASSHPMFVFNLRMELLFYSKKFEIGTRYAKDVNYFMN